MHLAVCVTVCVFVCIPTNGILIIKVVLFCLFFIFQYSVMEIKEPSPHLNVIVEMSKLVNNSANNEHKKNNNNNNNNNNGHKHKPSGVKRKAGGKKAKGNGQDSRGDHKSMFRSCSFVAK